MKHLLQILALWVPLLLVGCGPGVDTDAVPDPTLREMTSTRYNREVCEIYAAIITTKYASKTYVINTDPEAFACGANDSKGKVGYPFPFDGSGSYVLLSDAEEREIFKKGENGWERFGMRYPNSNGIIQLGPVEINKERTQAVLSASGTCGLTCGSGRQFTLHKKNDIWFVFSEDGGWVS